MPGDYIYEDWNGDGTATRAEIAQQLDALKVARLELPAISDGVDLGSLYELSESLAQQGVR